MTDCTPCRDGQHELCDTTADDTYCGCWADNHDQVDEPADPDDLEWQRDRAEDRTINYLIGE
jgi:hypothetical protein